MESIAISRCVDANDRYIDTRLLFMDGRLYTTEVSPGGGVVGYVDVTREVAEALKDSLNDKQTKTD